MDIGMFDERAREVDRRFDRIDATLERITQIQARTWEEVQGLQGDIRDVRRQLGGLSHTVSYELENRAYVSLPGLLERDHGIVTVLLTHMISEHDAEDYARENGIILYYSYQL